MKHLIFYDGQCPLCNRAVHIILWADKKQLFYFAPLAGKTAEKKLAGLSLKNPSVDTLVLLENLDTQKENVLIEGKAVFRILWLLGGKYALLGWLSFLPSSLFDCIYRIIARYRYHLFSKKNGIEPIDKRFLP